MATKSSRTEPAGVKRHAYRNADVQSAVHSLTSWPLESRNDTFSALDRLERYLAEVSYRMSTNASCKLSWVLNMLGTAYFLGNSRHAIALFCSLPASSIHSNGLSRRRRDRPLLRMLLAGRLLSRRRLVWRINCMTVSVNHTELRSHQNEWPHSSQFRRT